MKLFRAAMTVSSFTLLSRLTGLVRDTLLARTFGAGPAMDAFFIAFRIPNLLRRLFAEGAFSQAFVPMLGRIKAEQGDAAATDLIDAIALILLWAVMLLSIVGIVGAPVLVWLMASGQNTQTFDLTVLLTRVMFPYIACMSLVAMASGVLNTWKHFAIPAFTPVLLNVCMIIACVFLSPWVNPPILALAIGVMLGGIAQLSIQIPIMRRLGVMPRITLSWSRAKTAWHHPGTRTLLGNMAPALLGVGVGQISLLINTQIASHQGAGAVSWLSFADRLMEFPTALLGVALGTVLMPSLSKAAGGNDPQHFNSLLDWGLRLTCLLALPAAVAMVLLGQPLVTMLFHYGQFSTHDVLMTQRAVAAYAFGLIGFSLIKILAPAFFAQKNLQTPVKIALIVVLVTQLLNLLTVPWLGHAGLSLSISLGALLNAALLFFGLRRPNEQGTVLYTPKHGWRKFFVQIVCAAAVMGVFLYWCAPQFDWIALRNTPWLRVLYVLLICLLGGVIYFAMLRLSGLKLKHFLQRV